MLVKQVETELNTVAGRPHNPMINSGSIMIHALLQSCASPKMNMSRRFEWTQKIFKVCGFIFLGYHYVHVF